MALNNHKFVNNHIPNEEEVSLRSLSSEDVSQVVPRGYCCAKSINPADGRGRKLHLLQMLVLPFIPILALIVQTSVTLVNIMVLKHDSIEVENQVNNSFKMVPEQYRKWNCYNRTEWSNRIHFINSQID